MYTLVLKKAIVDAIKKDAPQLIIHCRDSKLDPDSYHVTFGIYNERNFATFATVLFNADPGNVIAGLESRPLIESVAA
jgi:hypothetical protein